MSLYLDGKCVESTANLQPFANIIVLGTLQPRNSATQITLFVLSISEKYDMDGSPSRVCFPRLTHTSYWPGCQSLESSSSDGSLSPRAELTFSPPSHSHLHSSCKTSRNDIGHPSSVSHWLCLRQPLALCHSMAATYQEGCRSLESSSSAASLSIVFRPVFSGYKSCVKRQRDYQIPYTTQQDQKYFIIERLTFCKPCCYNPNLDRNI